MPLILASSSPIRRTMLEQAGVAFSVERPSVDETVAKAAFDAHPSELAEFLAREKALSVGETTADWVIGSDSVVLVDGAAFDKPSSKAEAAKHLRSFSGKSLQLISAVALARDGAVEWAYADSATLRVRHLSDAFIADYLEAEWPEVSYCVGVFRIEGRGVLLFDNIEGSHFTILGMPLLPLLGALRERGLMPA